MTKIFSGLGSQTFVAWVTIMTLSFTLKSQSIRIKVESDIDKNLSLLDVQPSIPERYT